MKEMNLPEAQLRSWQPRLPSAGLKHRIFNARPRTSEMVMGSLRRLTPAAACLLVALVTFYQGGNLSHRPARPAFMVGMIGSNQIALAYLPDNSRQELNSVSPATFEWTNRSSSTSSISPFSPGKVN